MYEFTLKKAEVSLIRSGLDNVAHGVAKELEEILPEIVEDQDEYKVNFSPEQLNAVGASLGELPLKFSLDLFNRLRAEAAVKNAELAQAVKEEEDDEEDSETNDSSEEESVEEVSA